jgi:spore germination cell wall hydrolase CwlJ-like protein
MRFIKDNLVLAFFAIYFSSLVGVYSLHHFISQKKVEEERKNCISNSELFERYAFVAVSSVINSEASPDDIMDMYMVGSTVLNRAENEIFPSCLLDVVFQKGQYDGVHKNFTTTPASDSVASKLLKGLGRNKDVLFFYNYHTATDRKFIRLMEKKYTLITVTKNHKFYGV